MTIVSELGLENIISSDPSFLEQLMLGVSVYSMNDLTIVSRSKTILPEGKKIIGINGQSVSSLTELRQLLSQSNYNNISVTIQDPSTGVIDLPLIYHQRYSI